MKSSRSSSQLTDGGAAGGVAWLDEPLDFPFLSFLVLGFVYSERNIMCWRPWFGGHEVIHIIISVNTNWCLRWCSMTWRISCHQFLRRPKTITWRSFPTPSSSLRHNSTEDTYQFTEIWYWFVNHFRIVGVILAYNYTTIWEFAIYIFQITIKIRHEWELPWCAYHTPRTASISSNHFVWTR